MDLKGWLVLALLVVSGLYIAYDAIFHSSKKEAVLLLAANLVMFGSLIWLLRH